MREGWEMKKLGKVIEVQRGSSPRPIKNYLTTDSDGVNWVKIGDTKNVDKYIYSTKQKITKKGAEKSRFVDVGDFILTNSMSYGRPYIMKTQGYIHDGWFVFRLPNNINSDFFWYLLVSPNLKDQFESLAAGAIVKNISGDLVKKALLPIPPLTEQKQIVTLLDQAFATIDKAKANIEKNIVNAKELFQSKLNEIFSQKGDGWEEKTLGEVCENFDSKRVPITKSKRISGEIPYYGASGIVDYVADYLFDEDLLLVSEDGANLLARTYPIAFSISGKNWVNNHAHVLKFKDIASQKFIEFYLNSIKLDEYISGMAQPKLNQRKLNSIKIPFPAIEIQKETLVLLREISSQKSRIIDLYEEKLDNLEDLKKSLLQKAFAGELTKPKKKQKAKTIA